MASRFSGLPNYNYQAAPLDLLLKAGMAKDESIQQGVDKTQYMIDKIGGIETYGVLDTARKQIKLGELQKNIQALGGKDYTDPNTQKEINGLIQGFANDREVTEWISHAQNAKASNDFMEEQNKDQSYYSNNWKKYHDTEEAYNSQDPNTTTSKSPFTTPFYGLDYQDIGKETRDIVGAIGIGTLQPLTFDSSTGSYYTIEGKPAKNITDAVYSQLSDKSKQQIANDYNASSELQDTFVDVGAYFTSIAKDAATSYSVSKMDFTSPKNSGTSDGSSEGSGTTNTTGLIAPSVIFADAKTTTLPNDVLKGFFGDSDDKGNYNVSSDGTVVNFAKTNYGSSKSEKDINTIDIAGKLKKIQDRYINPIEEVTKGDTPQKYTSIGGQDIDFYRYKPEYKQYSKLSDEEFLKIVKNDLSKDMLNDPEYIQLMKEADVLGVDINSAKNKVNNLSKEELAGIELGNIINGLGDNIKFKVDISGKNAYNVEDKKFLSGTSTFTEEQLNTIFKGQGYSEDGTWNPIDNFYDDWQDIFIDKYKLIKEGTPLPDGTKTYVIPIKKQIELSDEVLSRYDETMTEGSTYAKNQGNFQQQRKEYFNYKSAERNQTNQIKQFQGNSKEERLKNLGSFTSEFNDFYKSIPDGSAKQQINNDWKEIFGEDGKKKWDNLKEKDLKILQLKEVIKQEKENPGTLQKKIDEYDLTVGGDYFQSNDIHENGYNIGDIAAKYESNGDPSTVGNIKGDKGGYSYGAFQFASGSGVPEDFLKSEYGKKYAKMFEGKGNSSSGGAFKSTWEKIGKNNSAQFKADQTAYAMDKYLTPVKELGNSLGLDLSNRSSALTEQLFHAALASPVVAKKVLQKVSNKINFKTASDKEILDAIFAEITKPNSDGKGLAYWSSQDPKIQENVKNTWIAQQRDLKVLLASENQSVASN